MKRTDINSPSLSQLLSQCKVAAELLEKQLKLFETSSSQSSQTHLPEDSILVYLLPLLCMLFRTRDQAAFSFAQEHSAFINAQLASKIKHLPTFFQLSTLLRSTQKPLNPVSANEVTIDATTLFEFNHLLNLLKPLSDESLGLTDARNFKESFLVKGTPPETSSQQVAHSLLEGWTLMEKAIEKMPQIH
ncbi:MAG: hypothetical protein K2X66_11610 [Cyanobacteria bacterium]|nr:hypothetical protein [Cyanobacteriota bacterium]